MSTDHLSVLFAGGGTGGHIFPNLAVLEALVADGGSPPTAHFMLSDRPIDATIAGEQSLAFTALPARPFGISPKTLYRFITHWGASVREARKVIRVHKARGRVVIVATGGFVSAPCVQAARSERVPVVMVNLDAVPGRANRWAASHAARVLTAAAVAKGPGKDWPTIPPIVRAAARAPGDPSHCRTLLELDAELPVLLVTGASLGARSINQLMTKLAFDERPAFSGWQILHQTGGTDADAQACADSYQRAGIRAVVRPFVRNMGVWWGAADLALGRCGAGIVAEAWANTVPAVFMPYPYHKDEHQRANAQPLVAAGAAEVLTDLIDPAANAKGAGATLVALMTSQSRRDEMRKACASLGPVDGAERVARVVREVAGGR